MSSVIGVGYGFYLNCESCFWFQWRANHIAINSNRLNHNKVSKSVPLLMKNHLSYTPFILLPQVYIAFHSTFPKISDIQLLSFIFHTTLKLLPTWLSQTLQICERSYFMLKIVAKTPRISLYSSYLHI